MLLRRSKTGACASVRDDWTGDWAPYGARWAGPLAGVRPGGAFLATLAYRVASYWLPLFAGPPAYLLFRHRYGQARRKAARSATADQA